MSFQGSTAWMQCCRSSDCWWQTVSHPGGRDRKCSVTQWWPSGRWYDEHWQTQWSQTLSGLHSSDLLKLVGQLGWCQTLLTLECNVLDPPGSFQHRCNVISLSSMTDQTGCCIDDGLELKLCKKVNQERVTVIKLHQHKTDDEWHNGMMRQQPLYAPQLEQDADKTYELRHERLYRSWDNRTDDRSFACAIIVFTCWTCQILLEFPKIALLVAHHKGHIYIGCRCRSIHCLSIHRPLSAP